MLNTKITRNFDNTITIITPKRVRFSEYFVNYRAFTCTIDIDKQEIVFGKYNSWEYEDDDMANDSYADEISPVYTFADFAKDLPDCIEKTYIWKMIFNDHYDNPRIDAPMWLHEDLCELTELMHEVRNLLVLSELLPINYTKEFHDGKHALKKENWLYRQFEEVLNS